MKTEDNLKIIKTLERKGGGRVGWSYPAETIFSRSNFTLNSNCLALKHIMQSIFAIRNLGLFPC